jgi:pimeloyl-ACP methyl ester carboxylesterase
MQTAANSWVAMPLPKIAVRTYGLGRPTVVVLHGGPGAPGSAAGLARGLSQYFHVIEPMQRRSGGPVLTVNQHAADLAGVCPSKSVIVGWSWGAMLALSFAARYPEKAAALVLVGCGTYDAKTRSLIEPTVLGRLSAAEKERRQFLLNALKTAPGGEERDKLLAEWGSIEDKASSYDASFDGDQTAQTLPVDAAGHYETWADVLRLQTEGIEPRIFAGIRIPVLMVHGDTDSHPGARTAGLLKRYMPRLNYIEIARCGHEPWRERHASEPFFDILSRWIEEKTPQ